MRRKEKHVHSRQDRHRHASFPDTGFALIATAQQPEPLPHVPLPEILPVAVRPVPEQRLTAPVRFFVPKRHADVIYNALLADIAAHDGLVIEHSAPSHSARALVPEGYLDRLSPLSTPSDGWFHQSYLDWFHDTVPLGATPQVQHTEGPTTELTVYVRKRIGPSNLAVDSIAGSLFATTLSLKLLVTRVTERSGDHSRSV